MPNSSDFLVELSSQYKRQKYYIRKNMYIKSKDISINGHTCQYVSLKEI